MSTIENKSSSNSVKIDVERIDAVLNMVGELVVLKSQLLNETREYHTNLKLSSLVTLFEKSIRELQDKSLGMRMTPLKSLFLKTQRVARDLSVKLNKPVEFLMSGEDTEIDRSMVEILGDPLLHIVRNALDHGIEKIDQRKTLGKKIAGTISLTAQQLGSRIIVTISDDGSGLSRDRIAKKALEKGLIPESKNIAELSNNEIYNLIFSPGFSTVEQVSEISGRGVGMDIVKTNIEKLRGSIDIKTEEGKGTVFKISIPLTTSITDGMLVKIANHLYILPLDGIRELVNFSSDSVTHMHTGRDVLNVRGKLLPILNLNQVLNCDLGSSMHSYNTENDTIVVVDGQRGLIALRVNGILGQVQVVLKSLSEYFSLSQGVAGAAILGDGKVALVIDVDNLKLDEELSA